MKKIAAFLLGILMCFAFVACTTPDENDDDDPTPSKVYFEKETTFYLDHGGAGLDTNRMVFKTDGTLISYLRYAEGQDGVDQDAARSYEITESGTKLPMWYTNDKGEVITDTYDIVTLANGRKKLTITFYGVYTINYYEADAAYFNRAVVVELDTTELSALNTANPIVAAIAQAIPALAYLPGIGALAESGEIMLAQDGTVTFKQTLTDVGLGIMAVLAPGTEKDTLLHFQYKIDGNKLRTYKLDEQGKILLQDGNPVVQTEYDFVVTTLANGVKKYTLKTKFMFNETYNEPVQE